MILSHLINQPQFKFLKRQVCYRKYISLLGTKWQQAIAFVYIKHETLYVAVTHPGFKMELHYNRDLLKSVLTQLSSHDSQCASLQVKEVVIFHSKYHPVLSNKEKSETIPYYQELAHNDFTVACKDPDLKKRFEKTKELIQCNR